MLFTYFKTAWRTIRKQKLLSVINIGSLAAGLTSVLFIAIFIETELRYDAFHSAKSDICRAAFKTTMQGNLAGDGPEFTAPFSIDAKSALQGIKAVCRLSEGCEQWFLNGERSIRSSAVTYADSPFFRIFSFPLLSGPANSVLTDPSSIVLTRSLAQKLFGSTDPMGKTISGDGGRSYIVSGVAQDPPAESTIQFEALLPFSSLYLDSTLAMGWNGGWRYQHYLQLEPGTDVRLLESKLGQFMWDNFNRKFSGTGRTDAYLQPLPQLHLYYQPGSKGLRTNLYIFACISLLILAISCINFINNSLARANSRLQEMGVRKVLGASSSQITRQVLGETFLTTFIALILAVFLAVTLMPAYEQLTGKSITLRPQDIVVSSLLMTALCLLITFISGAYLSYSLATSNPVRVFKKRSPASGGHLRRKPLLIVQFAISVGLIITVLTIRLQLNYLMSRSTGLDRKQLLVVPLTGNTVQDRSYSLKTAINELAGVESVSALSEIPLHNITQNGFLPEGAKDHAMFHQLDADADFLRTFNAQLASGRYFSQNAAGTQSQCVINETLARQLGWSDPINKTIFREHVFQVIGVVKDFNFASMHDRIGPLIITDKPWLNRYNYLAIKYNSGNPATLIRDVKNIWTKHAGGSPFEYWFLDDAFQKVYQSEQRFGQLFAGFTIISVILSLAGMFSLVLLNLQSKTKEIGVRKVLGATGWNVIQLSTKTFSLPILASGLAAIPVTWYYLKYWLENFAYRIELSWWIFVLPLLAVWLLAFSLIALQSIRAAMANPVDSLKVE